MNVDIYKALADENRLRILNMLVEHELCVCEIEQVLGISQSNASRHLNKLRQAGIVGSRRESQWIYYSFSPDFLRHYYKLYEHLVSSFDSDETMRRERSKAQAIEDACDRPAFGKQSQIQSHDNTGREDKL